MNVVAGTSLGLAHTCSQRPWKANGTHPPPASSAAVTEVCRSASVVAAEIPGAVRTS